MTLLAHAAHGLLVLAAHILEAFVELIFRPRLGRAFLALGQTPVDGRSETGNLVTEAGQVVVLALLGAVDPVERLGQGTFQLVDSGLACGTGQRVGNIAAGIRDDARHIVGEAVEPAFQLDIVAFIAVFQTTQTFVEAGHGGLECARGVIGRAFGALDAITQRTGDTAELGERLAGTGIAALGQVRIIARAGLKSVDARFQRVRRLARHVCQFAGLRFGIVQTARDIVLVLVETTREFHHRALDRLGRFRGCAAVGIGLLKRLHTICQIGVAGPDALDDAARVFELGLQAGVRFGDLVGELGDGLVESRERLAGQLFGGIDAFGQSVDHGADQAVAFLVQRFVAGKTRKGFQRVFPTRVGRVGFIEDDAVEPFAQSHAFAPCCRLGTRTGARVNPFDAPRPSRRHSESLSQLPRSTLSGG